MNAVLLAILQGFTEFLPISSTGHLVFAQQLLRIRDPQIMTFDIFVHFGTLLSVVMIYWKDLLQMIKAFFNTLANFILNKENKSSEDFNLGIYIIIGSIPAGLVGIIFHDQIEEAFTDPKLVAMNLVVTGLVLFLTRLVKSKQEKKIGIISSFFIGCAQAVAILPGISRSGLTMSVALYFKTPPVQAARFSFLLSVPVIAGAAMLEGIDLLKNGTSFEFMQLFIGVFVSAAAGFFAIKLLLRIMERGKFNLFAFYCLIVGILGIIFI